jgi:hypothetical protein
MWGVVAGYTGDTDDRLLSDVWIYRTPTNADDTTTTATSRALRR